MAISPPSDIVLDVLRAADPARVVAAERRLSSFGGSQGPETADFAKALDAAGGDASAGDARARLAMTGPATDKALRQRTDFEAMILSGFLNEMIPKTSGGMFGAGYAGDMWRSVMADQIARQIAKSGATGIAKSLFATHPLGKDQAVHASDVQGRARPWPAAPSNAASITGAGPAAPKGAEG